MYSNLLLFILIINLAGISFSSVFEKNAQININFFDIVEKLKAAEESLNLDIKNNLALGKIYFESEKYNEAKEKFNYVISLTPNNTNANFYMGQILLKEEAPQIALVYFEISLNQDNNNLELYKIISDIYQGLKKYDNALSYLLKGNKINPDDFEILQRLGNIYLKTKNYNEAENILRKLTDIKPDKMIFNLQLAEVLIKINKYEESLKYLDKALLLEPNKPIISEKLGQVYQKLSNNDKALSFFEKSFSINPDSPITLKSLGDIYFEKQDYTKSKIYYSKLDLDKLTEQEAKIIKERIKIISQNILP